MVGHELQPAAASGEGGEGRGTEDYERDNGFME
jgi:hypothetical protein